MTSLAMQEKDIVMAALSFLDLANPITPEVETLLHYFAKDTTQRILHNISKLDIKHSGALMSSISSTVYKNAGGNDMLVRFYYLNYARYLQHALGAYFAVDADLEVKKGKRQGVKRRNVEVPEMTSMENLKPSISGLPARVMKGKTREDYHKAKPFLDSEIRLHLRSTQRRLAVLCGFTASAYILHGFVRSMARLRDPNYIISKNGYSVAEGRERFNERGGRQVDVNEMVISWEPDFDAEKAWLKARGYLEHFQAEWGLSTFNKQNLEF